MTGNATGSGVGRRVGLVKCQAITLADGRQLLYYDERDAADRSAMDERELPPPPPASEVRYDPVLDEWVAIAAHRQGRTFLPPTDECPLCPSRPGHLTEIPAPDYDVVVFENRFPSFSERFAGELTWHNGDLVPVRHGAGRCEVVCFTADHSAWFGALSEARVRTALDVWADRTAALSELRDVEQVFCFENRGEEIGVTLHHPHGQIYAYPFVTPRTQRMLASAPYIAAWHQAPVHIDRDLASLHLQLFTVRRAPGKLKYLAGSESAMGVFINDVRPEDAAYALRQAGS